MVERAGEAERVGMVVVERSWVERVEGVGTAGVVV